MGVFTTHLKLVNSKVVDFIRVSMDEFDNHKNNFEEGIRINNTLSL